jgi:hypothetical protein
VILTPEMKPARRVLLTIISSGDARGESRLHSIEACPRRFSASIIARLGIAVIFLLPTGWHGEYRLFLRTSSSGTGSQIDAQALARDIFQNEIEAQLHDQSLWCYREAKDVGGKNRVSEVCQSKDGEIERLLAVNGRELGPEQLRAEDQRIQKLLKNPKQLKREQKKQQQDAQQARHLLKVFAEAFRFQYEGTEGNLVKLSFAPNPSFHARGHPERVFHHMEGSLIVDKQQKRLAEINGRLTSDVKFGGGLLGHLDKGGAFHVKQQDQGSGHWELTIVDVQMSGKALFFKTIAVRENERYTDFRQERDGVSPEKAFEALQRSSLNEEAAKKIKRWRS